MQLLEIAGNNLVGEHTKEERKKARMKHLNNIVNLEYFCDDLFKNISQYVLFKPMPHALIDNGYQINLVFWQDNLKASGKKSAERHRSWKWIEDIFYYHQF